MGKPKLDPEERKRRKYESLKKWRAANRKHVNAQAVEWRKTYEKSEEQKLREKEYKRKYFQENKAKRREYNAKPENREKSRIRSLEYYYKNPKKHRAITRLGYLKRASWFYAFKKTQVCSRCGFNDWRALEFHHRNPADKKFDISKVSRSHNTVKKEDIIKELAKCDPICSNCHKIEHSSHQYPQKFDIRLEYGHLMYNKATG